MSYDISLKDSVTGEQVYFDTAHQMKGGNYCIGGTNEARLNITYNYAKWYCKDGVFPNMDGKEGIRSIYGTSSVENIPVLENAIRTLENMTEDLTEEEIKDLRIMVYRDIGYRQEQMQSSLYISF